MKVWSKSNLVYSLTNEKGVSQVIIMIFGIVLFSCVGLVAMETSKFVITASELNDMSDSILRDSMRIHNGLTPATRTFIEKELERKGFDMSHISITGTPSAVPFGTDMVGTIQYDYSLPTFNFINSAIPTITVTSVPLKSEIHVYALGVVR
jgi:hypothetical protein